MCALNLGRRPEQNDVYNLIKSCASTCRDAKKAYLFAYASTNKKKNEEFDKLYEALSKYFLTCVDDDKNNKTKGDKDDK